MLVFEERGKPEYTEKNLSEQGRKPTTNSTHMWRPVWESNPGHIGGRRALSPLRHPCSPPFLTAPFLCDSLKFESPHSCMPQTGSVLKYNTNPVLALSLLWWGVHVTTSFPGPFCGPSPKPGKRPWERDCPCNANYKKDFLAPTRSSCTH